MAETKKPKRPRAASQSSQSSQSSHSTKSSSSKNKGGSPSRSVGEPRRSPSGGGGLRIKLVRSVIGADQYQRAVVRGLGLRRIHHVVERVDTPEIRGMIAKVPHLVKVVEA